MLNFCGLETSPFETQWISSPPKVPCDLPSSKLVSTSLGHVRSGDGFEPTGVDVSVMPSLLNNPMDSSSINPTLYFGRFFLSYLSGFLSLLLCSSISASLAILANVFSLVLSSDSASSIYRAANVLLQHLCIILGI